MVAASKFHQYPLNRLHCSEIAVHPGTSCMQFLINNAYRHAISNGKYFLPFAFIPFLLKSKNINVSQFRKCLKKYLELVGCATVGSVLVFFCVCVLRTVLGRTYKSTYCFIPTFMGMQATWAFPAEVVELFATATTQTCLHSALKYYTNPVTHFILQSKLFRTAVFAINSAIIMRAKRAGDYKGFWFIQPDARRMDTKTGKSNCVHPADESCAKHILSGMKSYLYYGIPLDIINTILKPTTSVQGANFMQKLMGQLKEFRLNSTAFFLSYCGVYRLINCLLAINCSQHPEELRHLIAAAGGGAVSYMCISRVNFYLLSTVLAVQILWRQFCAQPKEDTAKCNGLLELLKRIPFGRLIIPLNMGFLVHMYIFNYHTIDSLGHGIMHAITDDKCVRFHSIVSRTDVDTMLQEAKAIGRKGFF